MRGEERQALKIGRMFIHLAGLARDASVSSDTLACAIFFVMPCRCCCTRQAVNAASFHVSGSWCTDSMATVLKIATY